VKGRTIGVALLLLTVSASAAPTCEATRLKRDLATTKSDTVADTQASPIPAEEPTTVVIIRHADRDGSKDALSEPGLNRAKRVWEIFESNPPVIVFHTSEHRSKQTAQPAAKRFGVPMVQYPYAPRDVAAATAFAQVVLSQCSGNTLLVVGHSDTLEPLLSAFGKVHITPATGAYDRVYRLSISASGSSTLVVTTYGN
jgi:2,3-bisphosphoglycerate-dependent phosphoglycerate mutase